MLKRFSDLTSEEIIKLKREDLEQYIDIELLLEGIVPEIEPEPIYTGELKLQEVMTGYTIDLFSGIIFKTMEDALKVINSIKDIDIIKGDKHYNWEGYEREFSSVISEGKLPDLKIEVISFVSKEEYSRYKEIKEQYKKDLDEYNEDLKKYRKYIQKQSEIRDKIEEKWREELKIVRDFENFNKFIEYYKPMVGEEVAIINLYKAYKEVKTYSLNKFIDDYGYKEIIKKYQEQEGSENDY